MEAIAERIKEFRLRKGHSQEQLAALSGLNLRTIQRIEKGETVPRGDSLQRLALALQVTPDDLIDWTVKEDRTVLMILQLSQLSFLAFPILGIIIPLIIWINQKDKVTGMRKLGIQIFNFQITWTLLFFIIVSAFFWMPFLKVLHYPVPLTFPVLATVGMYAYGILVVLMNTIFSAQGKRVYYVPAFRILRQS